MMRADKRAFFLSDDGGGLARWKQVYYTEKLGLQVCLSQSGSLVPRAPISLAYSPSQSADELLGEGGAMRHLVFSYMEGLAWVLQYYYRGVASWSWYFPHHYAPMASDLCGQVLLDAAAAVSFQLGAPFAPFEQLLAVLPAASAPLLPPALRPLMLDVSSPIKDFYPLDFKIDFEGKRNEWEGIVQVPFIDEHRLLEAARRVPADRLAPHERARNALGKEYSFVYQAAFAEDYPSSLPRSFAGLFPSRCVVTPHDPRPALPAGAPGFMPVLVKGTRTGAKSPPGFPTLHTIPSSAKLLMAGCNVFGSASRKESLILKIPDLGAQAPSAEAAAEQMLGKKCFVSWPYLQEAMIVAVTDATCRVSMNASGTVVKKWAGLELDQWRSEAAKTSSRYLTTMGTDLGRVALQVHVTVCQGLVRHADGSLQKRFGGAELAFPLQVTLYKAPGGKDPRLAERGAQEAPSLASGEPAVFLGRSHFGSVARIVDGPAADGTYSVAVAGSAPDTGIAARVFASQPAVFTKSGAMARKLRLSPRLLGTLTGALWVRLDDAGAKVDCGLNLRSAKHGLCVPDYCRPAPDDDGGWEYTDAAAQLITSYAQRAPWLFKALADRDAAGEREGGGPPSMIDIRDALPGMSPAEAARQAHEAAAWLRKQPVGRRPLVKTSAVVAGEETLRALVAATSVPPASLPPVLLERVAPPLLLAPLQESEVTSVLAGGDFALGDRIVCLAAGGALSTPPFGIRGCVVGIHPWEVGASLEVLLDTAWESGTDLYGRVPKGRGALLPSSMCLNLSHPPPLPSLGAWAPPQRSRKPPPPMPPASGRVAWQADASEPANKPIGALAAAKLALAQLASLAPAVPAADLAKPLPLSKATKPAGAKKPAPAPATAAAAAAATAAVAKLSVGGSDAEPTRQQSHAGGRGNSSASGRGSSGPSGFAFATQQGRGRGRGAPTFQKSDENDDAPGKAKAAATEVDDSLPPGAGKQLLAMLHSGGSAAAPPPLPSGKALLAMVQPKAPAPATAPAPLSGTALLALVQKPGATNGSAPAQTGDPAAAALWATLQGGAAPPPSPDTKGAALLKLVGGGDTSSS